MHTMLLVLCWLVAVQPELLLHAQQTHQLRYVCQIRLARSRVLAGVFVDHKFFDAAAFEAWMYLASSCAAGLNCRGHGHVAGHPLPNASSFLRLSSQV